MKLIRDKLRARVYPYWRRTMDREEHLLLLQAKLLEEVAELLEAEELPKVVEEAADLLEVLDAYLHLLGVGEGLARRTQNAKFQRRGGFYEGTVWTKT